MRQDLVGYDRRLHGFKGLFVVLRIISSGLYEATWKYWPKAFPKEWLEGGLGCGALGNSIHWLAYQHLSIGASEMAQWVKVSAVKSHNPNFGP